MGFKMRAKGRERWSSGNLRWKTVPQTSGRNRKPSVTRRQTVDRVYMQHPITRSPTLVQNRSWKCFCAVVPGQQMANTHDERLVKLQRIRLHKVCSPLSTLQLSVNRYSEAYRRAAYVGRYGRQSVWLFLLDCSLLVDASTREAGVPSLCAVMLKCGCSLLTCQTSGYALLRVCFHCFWHYAANFVMDFALLVGNLFITANTLAVGLVVQRFWRFSPRHLCCTSCFFLSPRVL